MKREVLLSRTTILSRVHELARDISSDYSGKIPILIGILNGVVFFMADLVMAMSIPSKIDFIRASSYGSAMESSGLIKITKDVEIPIKGEPVILVEDIVDTGLTLKYIFKRLEERGPESIRICALIDKLERREEDIHIDYCGFRVEGGFLVGYGLDYNENFRYLPDICIISPEGSRS